MTVMKDWRLRFSAIKSEYRKKTNVVPLRTIHKNNCNENPKNENGVTSYFNVLRTNYCYYLLEKRTFESVADALEYRDELINSRLEKSRGESLPDKFHLVF
tara:strand:+ start:1099 stop:1401 length:303 start_codon:yes stop_codon:yes gene_type:complete